MTEKVTTFSDFITNEIPDFAYISEVEQDGSLRPLLSQMSSCLVLGFIMNWKRITEVTVHPTKSLRQNKMQKKLKARKVDSSNSKSIIMGYATDLSLNHLKGCAFEKENGTY